MRIELTFYARVTHLPTALGKIVLALHKRCAKRRIIHEFSEYISKTLLDKNLDFF